MWPDGALLDFQEGRTVGFRIMAEPPFVLLLIAPDEADRKIVDDIIFGCVDPGWLFAGFAGTGMTMRSFASVGILWSTLLSRSRDAVLLA